MNLFVKNKKGWSSRNKFFVPFAFIAAILIITWAFPKQGKFKYSFNQGTPWKYNLLTAPFDFPIYKTAEQLKQEQDSILAFYEPYYTINDKTKTEKLGDFDADMNIKSAISSLSPQNKIYLRKKLEEVYNNGIMNAEHYDKIAASVSQTFRLKEDNVASSKDINTFYTIRSAYEKIMDDRPQNFDKSAFEKADINNYLKENIEYDASTSEKAKDEFIQQVSPSIGMVQAGQRIVDYGEIVDEKTYNILDSYRRVTEERTGGGNNNPLIVLGEFLLTIFLIGSFHFYLLFFRPLEYHDRKHVMFMLLMIVFFVVLTAIAINWNLFNVFIIPYAIITIMIRTFIDSRTALFASIISILLSSLMVPYPFEFIVIQITVSMISIFMLKELSERSQLIRSSFFILLSYTLIYIGLVLYTQGQIKYENWITLLYFLINFIFIMFSYLLVYIFEKSFGFISGVSMVELANINKPLLRELSEKAPGTFQHSLQVSNLATAAAGKIGANASLVRTGALYHDIGKMVNPAFFTENQTPGMSPHDGLPFEESARIIISHVKDGVKMAKQHGLPQQIIDFIETHHATSMPKYFYISWKNAHPDKEANEADFRYPGPNPFSKETAILMMADAVEAASRSLKEYDHDSIRELVYRIIDSQLAEGYFYKAPITFKEIDTIKELFVEKLMTIYHSRIAYPELKKKALSPSN